MAPIGMTRHLPLSGAAQLPGGLVSILEAFCLCVFCWGPSPFGVWVFVLGCWGAPGRHLWRRAHELQVPALCTVADMATKRPDKKVCAVRCVFGCDALVVSGDAQ